MDSELEKYFSDLSELNKVEDINEETCCTQIKNQQVGDGVVLCR